MDKRLQSRKLKYFALWGLLILLCCTIPTVSYGQMFSADNARFDRSIPDVGIYAGIEPMSMQYQGDSGLNMPNAPYAFDGTILRLAVETRGIAVTLGAGGSTTGIEDVSYFDAGIKLSHGFNIFYSRNFNLKLPLQLQSTITNVSNDEVVNPNIPQFNQGTLEFAGGLDMNVKLAERTRFSANIIPSYGFSFSTHQRDASGSIFGVEGEARLFFDQLFGSAGLSLGYNYNFRRYDIGYDKDLLDYSATGHSILVGVTF